MQNLRDLAWTTVYFALLGCTSPVLEALYVNAPELDQMKERVRRVFHRHLGLRHFETLNRGPNGIYFPERSCDFSFYLYEGPIPRYFDTTVPAKYIIETCHSGNIRFRFGRSAWNIYTYSKDHWFNFLESDLNKKKH